MRLLGSNAICFISLLCIALLPANATNAASNPPVPLALTTPKAPAVNLGTWLDSLVPFNVENLYSEEAMTTVRFHDDGFIYPGHPQASRYWGDNVPDGTPFTHPGAGPRRSHIVYDAAHRIALYDTGCCSYQESIAVAGAPLPPVPVRGRDLGALRTLRGASLGDVPKRVMKLYGSARLRASKNHPGWKFLSYTNFHSSIYQDAHSKEPNVTCGKQWGFIFHNERLSTIEIYGGC
jgi:hypothetical protein